MQMLMVQMQPLSIHYIECCLQGHQLMRCANSGLSQQEVLCMTAHLTKLPYIGQFPVAQQVACRMWTLLL